MRAIAVRALGLALGLNDRHAEGVEALSEALPMVTQGGLAYFFEANVLATLALVQQHAVQLEDAERSSRAAIGSAPASGSRVWAARKSVESGKSVSVPVDLGGRRIHKKKNH